MIWLRDPDSPLPALSAEGAGPAGPGAARALMQYVDRDLARPVAARIQADRPEGFRMTRNDGPGTAAAG